MKKQRKLLALLICTMLMSMLGNPVLAQSIVDDDINSTVSLNTEIDISDIELGEIVVLPDGAVLSQISLAEYVSIISKEKNISLQEAYKLEAKERNMSLLSVNEIIYYKYSKIVTYSKNRNFSAKLVATIKVYSSGSFREIRDISGIGSRANSGIHTYEWDEMYAWSDPKEGSSGFPTTSITIGASGYFITAVSSSVGAGLDIPGFSVEATYGGMTYFYSDDLHLEGNYRVY